MNVIAIIPARGGSKRLPGKNIAILNGKPLIAYSIEAWNKSKYCTIPAIVSTDDGTIGHGAIKYGAQAIYRPASLAQDDTPMIPVIKHIIDYLAKYQDYRTHWILILQPTSPLRTVEDIDACLDIVAGNLADSVTSICPETSKYETGENGAIYVTHADLINQGKLYGDRLYKYPMKPENSIDIDTQEDLEKAEGIIKKSFEQHDISKNRSEVNKAYLIEKGKRKKAGRSVRK